MKATTFKASALILLVFSIYVLCAGYHVAKDTTSTVQAVITERNNVLASIK